jgi:hypothetical protein
VINFADPNNFMDYYNERKSLQNERSINKEGLEGLAGKIDCECKIQSNTGGGNAYHSYLLNDIECCKQKAATLNKLNDAAQKIETKINENRSSLKVNKISLESMPLADKKRIGGTRLIDPATGRHLLADKAVGTILLFLIIPLAALIWKK